MGFWDDLAKGATDAVNGIIQDFVPGAPPIPTPPVPDNLPPPPGVPDDIFSQNNGGGGTSHTHGSEPVPPAAPQQNDRFIVLDLIDCLQKPPPIITAEYVKIVERVSSWVGRAGTGVVTSEEARTAWLQHLMPERANTNSQGPNLIGDDLTANEAIRNGVNKCRNDVLDVAHDVAQLAAAGPLVTGIFVLVDPFAFAASFNNSRMGFRPIQNLTDANVKTIADGVRQALAVLNQQNRTFFNPNDVIKTTADDAAQLASAEMSLEGFGGSGNTQTDINKLTPEQEAIRAQKALDALSVLDFTKRVPKVLFTAFYRPSGDPLGIIVGWKKMADASGYVITRRDLFTGKEVTKSLTNADTLRDTKQVGSYVRSWILSFYDQFPGSQLLCYLDPDFRPDTYYYYTVQAYQLQNTDPGATFAVPTSPAPLSDAQKFRIRRAVEALSVGPLGFVPGSVPGPSFSSNSNVPPPPPGASSSGQTPSNYHAAVPVNSAGSTPATPSNYHAAVPVNSGPPPPPSNYHAATAIGGGPVTPSQGITVSISIYPFISQELFGTPDNDWLLAALNSRASISRNDDRATTRKYGYLSAQLDFIFAQADAGKFVVPKGRDFGPVNTNLKNAVATFGVNQVIRTLLQETGAVYHFDGSEPNDDALFKNIGNTDPEESSLILTVASAIDPETATLDMKVITANMPPLLAGQGTVGVPSSRVPSSVSAANAKNAEIAVPGDIDGAPEITVTSEIQNLQKLGNTGQLVDLTTVAGLGTLMRVIRIYSDAGGNRGSPAVVDTSKVQPGGGGKVAGPPPPPISTTNPVNVTGGTSNTQGAVPPPPPGYTASGPTPTNSAGAVPVPSSAGKKP